MWAICAGCKIFCGAINGVDVIIAVMKEITHFFPWAGGYTGVFATQGFIKIGKPFMGLAMALVQLDKGTCQPRGVGRRQL